ncbi:LysR substrate-binding domain-containing protein [Paraburkholderia sp. J67]|uniref:LysR substrate-binding domain-containing protein n=1 Tax=Paraburkholderia sp. J67 TaxID=2805435 RepID=UPI002ABD941C|nr:LysR substrate-binding domain-containing protein [Paraburkholderia sp. J67]
MSKGCAAIEVEADPIGADFVGRGFDFGVRLGEDIEKDMVITRIGPDIRMAVVGSPSYFADKTVPRSPEKLSEHACIAYRRPLSGRILPWEFSKRGRSVRVRVDGSLVFNRPSTIVTAAKDGHGIGYVPEDYVLQACEDGQLVRILEDWCSPFPGFHLYYTRTVGKNLRPRRF